MNVDLIRLVLRDVLVKLRENVVADDSSPGPVKRRIVQEMNLVKADLEVGEVSIVDFIRGRLEEHASKLDPMNLMDSAADLLVVHRGKIVDPDSRHLDDLEAKKSKTGFSPDFGYPAVFVDDPTEFIIQGPRGPWPPNWLLPSSVCEIIDGYRKIFGHGQQYVVCRVVGEEPIQTHYRVYPIHPATFETNEAYGSHATSPPDDSVGRVDLDERRTLMGKLPSPDRKRETVGDLADRIFKASVERFRDNTPGEVTCEDLESRIESMLAVLAKEVAAIIVRERTAP